LDPAPSTPYDPIRLEVFKHLFAAIAEEMGVTLRRSSYSPNIKERRDFSCAVFDAGGKMIAQAAHIPVHLGSMPLSVAAAIQAFPTFEPGDILILNDPFRGGTHLPDITLVSPVFVTEDPAIPRRVLAGFVASRAHHADVGGITAGSMPIAREIYQEGLVIPPVKLFSAGEVNQAVFDLILANVRTPEERLGDLWAQIAANRRGEERLCQLVYRYGLGEVERYMQALLAYTERMTRKLIENLPDGNYQYTDYLDNDGIGEQAIPITASIWISGDTARVDFTGSAAQLKGSVNAVFAITLSAVYYVFRCLIDLDVPNNSGCLVPIELIAPEGTVVNALPPAPVAGGNVETSQRIVDVLLGALYQACPERIPAASQGTMNNLTIGGWDPEKRSPFTYYETIGGGMGARAGSHGPSAIHSHMTNTLNTPVEALEYAYPLQVLRYEIRRGSGGAGLAIGGNGIRRDIRVMVDAQMSFLTERRVFQPYGLAGGRSGKAGENRLIRAGESHRLPGKGTIELKAGDIISIRTPGGGGFGEPPV
jgi:N-methylhydantoinase B